jgi:hypothetical protein
MEDYLDQCAYLLKRRKPVKRIKVRRCAVVVSTMSKITTTTTTISVKFYFIIMIFTLPAHASQWATREGCSSST